MGVGIPPPVQMFPRAMRSSHCSFTAESSQFESGREYHFKKEVMSKIEKKKNKLKERIEMLENEIRVSLTKKDSNTREINVPAHMRQINDLKLQLQKL